MEMYAKLHAVAIKIAYPMNAVFVVFVARFVIAMLLVDKGRSVKTVCVKLDVEVMLSVQVTKRALTTSVLIHVQQQVNVVNVPNVPLSTTVFNAVVLLVSLETL